MNNPFSPYSCWHVCPLCGVIHVCGNGLKSRVCKDGKELKCVHCFRKQMKREVMLKVLKV